MSNTDESGSLRETLLAETDALSREIAEDVARRIAAESEARIRGAVEQTAAIAFRVR